MSKDYFLLNTIAGLFQVFMIIAQFFGLLYFYELAGGNILYAVAPFALSYLSYALLVSISSRIVGKIGTQNSFYVGFILMSLSVIPTIVTSYTGVWQYSILWFVLFFAGKLFFHPADVYLMSKLTDHKHRGEQVSYKKISQVIVWATTPLLGGLITEQFGFQAVLLFASVVILLAIIPAMFMENHNFKLKFNLRDMLRRKGIRRSWALHFRSEMQAGGERIWPIFLLTVFGGSYQLAGGVTAATTSISLLLLYTIGKYLDSGNRQTILKRGAMLYSLSWVGRFIFVTPTVLPVADTFGKFSSLARDQAIETIDLDNITDGVSASMQDEFVTVREMGVDIAISLSLISHALIAHFFGIEAAFLFSATMGLLFLLDL